MMSPIPFDNVWQQQIGLSHGAWLWIRPASVISQMKCVLSVARILLAKCVENARK